MQICDMIKPLSTALLDTLNFENQPTNTEDIASLVENDNISSV